MFREPSYHEFSSIPDKVPSTKLKTLTLLLSYLKPYKLELVGAVISLMLAAFSVLGLGHGLRFLVDQGFSHGRLTTALGLMFATVVLMGLASYGRFYFVSWIGEQAIANLRKDLFAHLLTLSPRFYETMPVGEIIARLSTDTTLLQVLIGTSIAVSARNLLLFIGGAGMMFVSSHKLALLVLGIIPFILIVLLIYGRYVRNLTKSTQQALADLTTLSEETFAAIRTIQAFTREKEQQSQFITQLHFHLKAASKNIHARGLLTSLVITIVFAALTLVLWIGGKDVLREQMTAGQLSAFLFYAVVAAASLGSLSEAWGDLQRAAGASERLKNLLNIPSPLTFSASPESPSSLPHPTLAFRNVSFAYPSRPDQFVLQNISLAIEEGEMVAFVGPSGAGKSTLFELLLRFYPLTQGNIFIGGKDISSFALPELRQLFGWVGQDPVIFSTDAFKNIAFAEPSASLEEITEAAKAAHALDFIESLPEGFNTFLGEKGIRLSGGQKQRLAIARALLKQAPILLLDEATSALDNQSERAIQEAIENLKNKKTILIIAHRLSTIMKADRIFVLNEGKIVGEGVHEHLLLTCPLYQDLYALSPQKESR